MNSQIDKKRKFTEQEDQIIRDMWNPQHSVKAIAARIRTSHKIILRRAAEIGLPTKPPAPRGRERSIDRQKIIDLWRSGIVVSKISETLGCSERVVRDAINDFRRSQKKKQARAKPSVQVSKPARPAPPKKVQYVFDRPNWPKAADDEIAASRGHYDRLADIELRHRLPVGSALPRWHVLRVQLGLHTATRPAEWRQHQAR